MPAAGSLLPLSLLFAKTFRSPKAQGVRILAWLRHSVLSERLA